MFPIFKPSRMLLAGVLIIVLATAACLWWVLEDRDVTIFDGLDVTQLNAIAAELDRASIAYQLKRESGAIAVAAVDAPRARLVIMSSGNAFHEAVGFELFNGSDFGMTEFAQRINYQRAIEGELSRTIGALGEIKYARVHLVLPEHSLFHSQQQEPRAAVTVFLERDVTLNPSQVRGIQRLTASAVPELEEKSVTVLDESGVVLSSRNTDDPPEIGGHLAQKQAIEGYLADKARTVLSKALGVERFAVSVDVSLDYSQRTTTTERVLDVPANAAIKRLKETSRVAKGEHNGDERLREVEYNAGREVEQITHGGGTIRRIQAGIIIDQAVTAPDVEQLQGLVAAALGTDASRGDRVTVIRHSVAAQRVLENVARHSQPQSAPTPRVTAPTAQHVTHAPWIWIAFAVLLLSVGAITVGHKTLQRRQLLRQQDLRKRLSAWIDAEPVQVEQA